jgi:hypothetical protein
MADETTPDESGLIHAALMQRYGSRLSPEMAETLRGAVESVLKTVAAVRAVPLANGEAPLLGFAPVRKED